jgi:DedD protein
MGLLSKLKSSSGARADKRAGATPALDANDVVRDARTRARRRLIGAAILLGVGIIGFPLLFETQPRPIAVDIPIEIPSRDGVAPLQAPPARPARAPAAEPAPPPVEGPLTASVDTPPSAPATPPVAAAPQPEPKPETRAPEPKPDVKPAPKPAEPKPDTRAEAKPEPKPATKPEADKPTAADDGRFVVQIGAFAEAGSAREARQKVEAMGLKTYTQVIESDTGRRIRVRIGPYGTKAEADKAAARIKASGLPAAVLKL